MPGSLERDVLRKGYGRDCKEVDVVNVCAGSFPFLFFFFGGYPGHGVRVYEML